MLMLTTLQYGLGLFSGGLVGLTLGLFGGGGSILAVPLMIYLVGVTNTHLAIGTSAVAVAANAALNLLNHARLGNVKWRCAAIFSAAGIVGAFLGSSLGKAVDGRHLLIFFAALMIVIAAMMFFRRGQAGDPEAQCTIEKAPKVLGAGAATGLVSGFFGIGGGFLIVPGLIKSTGMPLLNAVGSSLVAVTAFGLTTALNYAVSGLVNWPLAAVFVAGGLIGGLIGAKAAHSLSLRKGALDLAFVILLLAVAAYMLLVTP